MEIKSYLRWSPLVILFVLVSFSNKQQEKTMFSLDALNLPETPFDYDLYFPSYAINTIWGASLNPDTINAKITPHGATLGRVLFYDKKVSASNELACASCHKQEFAFADNVQFSEGINGTLSTRNSPNINALAWNGEMQFGRDENSYFWDIRETNLEEMVLQPIEHEGELGKDLVVLVEKLENTEYYAPLFENAFGDPAITPERIGSALAQFVRSISSFNTKFDWVQTGESAFTPQEQQGANLFRQSCDNRACHSQPHFGNAEPMNTGLESEPIDLGLGGWSGIETQVGEFKSPTLRNVALTAPYMHDGRFATLEEVLDFYSDEVVYHPNNDFEWVSNDPTNFRGFNFSQSQKDAIIAFLNTLTDPYLITAEKWSNPFTEVSSTTFLPLETEVTIFPNPARHSVTIQIDEPSHKAYHFRLYTADGKLQRSFSSNDKSVRLERNQLAAGLYILEIRSGNQKKVEQVVFGD